MWKEGIIGIPTKDEEYKKVKYWVKYFDEPSEDYGISEMRNTSVMLFSKRLTPPIS